MQSSVIRVLVVDDYDPWRRFVALALGARKDVQIAGEAQDGLTAIQKALELRPDVVILDIGLPDLSGIDVAREIRDANPNIRILFLTEHTQHEIVRKALKTGAGGYVVKSGAARDLLPAFESLLVDDVYVSPLATSLRFVDSPPSAKCECEQ